MKNLFAGFLFYLTLSVLCHSIQAQNNNHRAFIFDSKHNSYEECDINNQYSIITTDSSLKTGTIKPISNKAIVLISATKTDTILVSDIWHFALSSKPSSASVGSKIAGYCMIVFGGFLNIGAVTAIADGESGVAAGVLLFGIPMLTGGILILNAKGQQVKETNNRLHLMSDRYRLRIVKSTL